MEFRCLECNQPISAAEVFFHDGYCDSCWKRNITSEFREAEEKHITSAAERKDYSDAIYFKTIHGDEVYIRKSKVEVIRKNPTTGGTDIYYTGSDMIQTHDSFTDVAEKIFG